MNDRDRRKVTSIAGLLPSLVGALSTFLAGPIDAQLPGQPAQHLAFPVMSPGIPAYARLELLIPNFDVPNDRHWAAIVFYRDPACVPPTFDLGRFFDLPGPAGLGAFGCRLLVEGHEIWQNGQAQGDRAPIYVRTRNATPNLPIWFVAWDELNPLLARGQIYIGEIAGLRSLIKGSASWFEEALYPHEAAAQPGITMRAAGRLETGGAFNLDWRFVDGEPEAVSIRLQLLGKRPLPRPCLVSPYFCN
jgi:hypothetical protein